MTVGILNDMIRKVGASNAGKDSASAIDDGSAKYGQPLLATLNDHLAYDEPYTTDASPHQYRIWLAQVCSHGSPLRRSVDFAHRPSTTMLASVAPVISTL